VRLRPWIEIENQATNFAQELATDVRKFIMLAVEAIHIRVNHLQKGAREKVHREETPESAQYIALATSTTNQRSQFQALCQLCAAKKIAITIQHGPQVLVRAEKLHIDLDQWGILAKRLHFGLLLRHNLVHHFGHGRGLLSGCRKGRCTQRQDESQDL